MKILIDLDPRDVWRFQARAEHMGVTAGEVVRDELTVRRDAAAVRDRIRSEVAEGKCDADIAEALHYLPGTVAGIRRSLGMKANPRYPRREAIA